MNKAVYPSSHQLKQPSAVLNLSERKSKNFKTASQITFRVIGIISSKVVEDSQFHHNINSTLTSALTEVSVKFIL